MIYLNKKLRHLGVFETREEAAKARQEWEKKKEVEECKVELGPAVISFCEGDDLTRIQAEVVLMIMLGMTYQEMADYLGLCISAIKDRLNSVFGKIDAENRIQLMADIYDIAAGGRE